MPVRASSKIRSAGLLLFRQRDKKVQVLLAHPGGPFWSRKDQGVWTIPKGLIGPSESLLSAAHVSSPKRPATVRAAKPFLLAVPSNRAARSSTCGQLKGTGIQSIFRATHSRWNGLRGLGDGNHFLRSIARLGLA